MTLTKEQSVRRLTWIGLIANLALSALKGAIGVAAASQTLIADAVHSLSDGISDVAVIAGSYVWARPPDASHPYGHRRVETLVTLFIGGLLVLAGLGIGWQAINSLHRGHDAHPGWPAVGVAALSIIVKEAMYRWTRAAGRRLDSTAVMANAWHHRLDALSSIPALIAVATAAFLPGWGDIDAIGAIVVCTMILHGAYRILKPRLHELTEAGAPRDRLVGIGRLAAAVPGVIQVHAVRSRYVSTRLILDLHIVVDGALSVRQGHVIAETVKTTLLQEEPDIMEVVVHTEPDEHRRRDDANAWDGAA